MLTLIPLVYWMPNATLVLPCLPQSSQLLTRIVRDLSQLGDSVRIVVSLELCSCFTYWDSPSAYLGLGRRVRSFSDIGSGLFLCTHLLQFETVCQRFLPGAINFLVNSVFPANIRRSPPWLSSISRLSF